MSKTVTLKVVAKKVILIPASLGPSRVLRRAIGIRGSAGVTLDRCAGRSRSSF